MERGRKYVLNLYLIYFCCCYVYLCMTYFLFSNCSIIYDLPFIYC